MNRSVVGFLLTLTFVNACLCELEAVAREWGGPQGQRGPSPQAQPPSQARAQQPNQDAARQAREQQVRAQEDQARQTQQAAQRQQQDSMRQQQDQMRQQQDLARKAQQDQQRQQQEAARQQQDAAKQQQDAAKQQQEQERRAQQDQQKQQQEAGRQAQDQERRAQQVQPRQQEQAPNNQERQLGEQSRERSARQSGNDFLSQTANVGESGQGRANEVGGGNSSSGGRSTRPNNPPALRTNMAEFNKAIPTPQLQGNISASERNHAQSVEQNLHTHLYPVASNSIPSNYSQYRSSAVSNYLNNSPFSFDNRSGYINRENTYFNPVPQYEYPAWWNPQTSTGWVYSNGFSLGSYISLGLDWLRWGWHPYYGPPPDGFVCASDYIPTQWIYVPAYGLWRQAGIMGWAPAGPPYDYEGPITVEMLETRHIHTMDPYTGMENTTVVNVPYFYNACYVPEEGRWGYTNRHGYFVWISV